MGARRIRPDADLDGLFGPAWITLQSHYPELPDCQFRRMEHEVAFAALEVLPADRVAVHVAPGMLNFHPDLRFLTLMHEAAHALDYARNGGISGHGERFAGIVRAMGMAAELQTAEPGERNYEPRITDAVRQRCADVLALLAERCGDAVALVQQ